MSYTPPAGNAINFSFAGAVSFTPPAGSAVNFSFQRDVVGEFAGAVAASGAFSGEVSDPLGLLGYFSGAIAAAGAFSGVHGVAGAMAGQVAASGACWGAVGLFARPATRAGVRNRWTGAESRRSPVRAPSPAAAVVDRARRAPWATGRRLASADFIAWGMATVADAARMTPWGSYATRSRAATWSDWPLATVADTFSAAPWGSYSQHRSNASESGWHAATVADMAALAPWAQYAARLGQAWISTTPAAETADSALRSPWGSFAHRLQPGWGAVSPPDDVPQTDPAGTLITPILRSYIVLNEISLVRISNGLALPVLNLSITADADSWTYSWQASVPGSKLDDVLPATPGEPIEFAANINGWPHRLIAEKISLDRNFGKARVNISGRGIAAMLAAPYAAAEARDNLAQARNASQLCDDALLINNVPASGWTINFKLDDWQVAAGAWVTHGAPMDAISGIASAAGGYVRSDPTAKILHIESRYPVKPWEWGTATPDYQLPVEATTRVGVEWVENAPYNAVYITGTGPGAVLGKVKRAGTAGDLVAPMETDALITHVAAARQRGTAILGNAGRGQRLTLETPVLEVIGPYPVGSLIRFVDGATPRLGLVRGVTINAGMPKVRQTLEVECHD